MLVNNITSYTMITVVSYDVHVLYLSSPQFRSVQNLLDPNCDVQGKVDLLMGKGFSKQDTFDLISQCPSLLTHDTAIDFKPKLE